MDQNNFTFMELGKLYLEYVSINELAKQYQNQIKALQEEVKTLKAKLTSNEKPV